MSTGRKEPKTGPAFFPPVVELARDKGCIGKALSTLPIWMLRAADRWAEGDSEAKMKNRDPARLPFPDPWRFLLDCPTIPEPVRKVCRGAQSQLFALRHLSRLAMGVATLNTDWQREAVKA